MAGQLPLVAAVDARRELGLGDLQPVDIFRILAYQEHISVVRCPFGKGSRMSGLFLRKGNVRLIVVNTCTSWGHQIFTAAHEYYHLRHSAGMSGSICVTGTFSERSPEEFDADRFAAAFLAPTAGLDYLIKREFGGGRLGIGEIIYLEQYFAVSHAAMLRRLTEIGKITRGELDEFRPEVISKARRLGFSTRLYEKTRDYEIVSDLPRKVREALERDLISEGKAREFLLAFGQRPIGEQGGTGDDVDHQ